MSKNLKIAYIYLQVSPLVSLLSKAKEKADSIKEIGQENFDIYVLNPSISNTDGNIYYVKYNLKPYPLIYFDYFFKYTFCKYKLIENHLPLNKYDYLIIRYPRTDYSGFRLFKKYKVVTEHHTNDVTELCNEYKYTKGLFAKFTRYIRYCIEKKYGGNLLELSHGNVGVTDEIIGFISERCTKNNVPRKCITNGIRVKDIPMTSFKPFEGKTMDIAFVSSSFSIWHGLDRLLKSITNYKNGKVKINLHLIGETTVPLPEGINLVKHGIKEKAALNEILGEMNLAVGSLAMYLNGLNEGSCLKTRDYTARGIPFILAYKDPDLQYVDSDKKFFLEFPNNESPIDFDQVIQFAENLNKKFQPAELSQYMRQYSLQYMDWNVKMQAYVDFVSEIDEFEKAAN